MAEGHARVGARFKTGGDGLEELNGAPEAWRDMYAGQRVLVTGASGFIGRWVCRMLAAARAEIALVVPAEGGLSELLPAYGIRGTHVVADLSVEGEFERVGGTRTIQVDARVIAATHKDLHRAIDEGSFGADLFYRLNVFPLAIPPLKAER